MKDEINTVGVRMRELRKNMGLRQEDIAHVIGLKRANVTKYENGSLTPPSDVLGVIADALKTTSDYLLGKTKNPNSLNSASEFIGNLDLSDAELFAQYNFNFDGAKISDEEARGIIAFLRASRQMKK